MFTPEKFIGKWIDDDSPLIKVAPRDLDALRISAEAKRFLAIAGLPKSAAPFLGFDPLEKGVIQTVSEMWRQPTRF